MKQRNTHIYSVMDVDTCTPEQFSTRTEFLATVHALDKLRVYVLVVIGADC